MALKMMLNMPVRTEDFSLFGIVVQGVALSLHTVIHLKLLKISWLCAKFQHYIFYVMLKPCEYVFVFFISGFNV